MSIKSTIAAVAASPFLFAGAAFAGPYVNVEANGSYPGGEYVSGNLEAQVGYEGTTEGGLAWYVSAGPTVNHTESADEFGDVELAGYLGASKCLTESVVLTVKFMVSQHLAMTMSTQVRLELSSYSK